MKLWIKTGIIPALLFLCVTGTAADPQVEYELRQKATALLFPAREKSLTLSYSATAKLFDHGKEGKYRVYRLVEDDGFVLKRAEVLQNNEAVETYIQNRDGDFGTIRQKSHQLAEAFEASLPEHLALPITDSEFYTADYTIEETGIPGVINIVMDVTDSEKVHSAISRSPSGLTQTPEPLLETRPFKRILTIDTTRNAILGVREWNKNGKRLYELQLSECDWNPPARELFQTPSPLEPQKITTSTAMRALMQNQKNYEQYLQNSPKPNAPPPISQRISQWLFAGNVLPYVAWGLGSCSALLLIGIAIYNKASKKK